MRLLLCSGGASPALCIVPLKTALTHCSGLSLHGLQPSYLHSAAVFEQGDDMTALMLAAAAGHEACVKELLYAGK